MFAVPRSAYAVVDSWSSVGMRATGSNTLVLDEVIVPAGRTFRREDLFAGRAVDSTAPCHSVPLQAANGLSFATPTLGAAQGALRSWSQYVGEKLRTASVPGRLAGQPAAHEQTLSRSSGEIDAAELLLERASAVADLGSAVSPLQTARNLRDCSLAVQQLVTAVATGSSVPAAPAGSRSTVRCSASGGTSTRRPPMWRCSSRRPPACTGERCSLPEIPARANRPAVAAGGRGVPRGAPST